MQVPLGNIDSKRLSLFGMTSLDARIRPKGPSLIGNRHHTFMLPLSKAEPLLMLNNLQPIELAD